jgi:pyruvate dehydrogenase (quinone)
MGKKVADIIVETLQKAGVKHCYGVVGDTLNLVAHSIAASKIEWGHMRHEEAGAFAAQAEALVHVHVNPMQLVMPPFMAVEPAIGMALYSTRAILHGRGGDVWEMVKENFI